MVAPTIRFSRPLESSWLLAEGELVKLSTVMVSPAELEITIESGNVIMSSAFGSPATSNLAGVPEVFVFIVAPPVDVLDPSTDIVIVPGIELAPISPNTMPFCAVMLMVDTILASTVAVAVAASTNRE